MNVTRGWTGVGSTERSPEGALIFNATLTKAVAGQVADETLYSMLVSQRKIGSMQVAEKVQTPLLFATLRGKLQVVFSPFTGVQFSSF